MTPFSNNLPQRHVFVKNYFSWNGFQREPSHSLRWYLSEGQSVQNQNQKVFCFQVIVRNFFKKKKKISYVRHRCLAYVYILVRDYNFATHQMSSGYCI